jgi:plasmid stabilization system protein ParE
MSKYSVSYSDEANSDFENLAYAITVEYGSPTTAFRYVQGIIEAIDQMAKNPEAYPIRFNLSLLEYGLNARRLNYKKMAIIYTINDDETVYIHRVIASSLITEA